MNTKILFHSLHANKALPERVERRIEYGFGSLRSWIEAVRVDLSKLVESRGGKDKSCRVQVLLHDGQKIMLEILDSDLHVALHRAIDRASWTVARRLQRNRREANAGLSATRITADPAKPEWAA